MPGRKPLGDRRSKSYGKREHAGTPDRPKARLPLMEILEGEIERTNHLI
jgi:hypothetical protein